MPSLDANVHAHFDSQRSLLKDGWEYFIDAQPSEDLTAFPQGLARERWNTLGGRGGHCFNPPGPKNPERIWFRVNIEEHLSKDMSVYVRAIEKPIFVFADQKLIHSYNCDTGVNFCGWSPAMFPIPEKLENPYLYFLTLNHPRGPAGLCFEIYVGKTERLSDAKLGDGLSNGVMGLFGLFCAFTSFVVALVMRTYRPFLNFGAYMTCLGIWLLAASRGPVLKFLVVKEPFTWWYFSQAGLYLSPVFLINFYSTIDPTRKTGFLTALRGLKYVHLGFVGLMLLEWVHVIPTYISYGPLIFLSYLYPALILSDSLTSVRKGTLASRIFSFGFVFMSLFFFHGLLVSKRLIKGWSEYQLHFPLLVFIVCSFIVAAIKMREELRVKQEIKEENIRLNAISNAGSFMAHDTVQPIKRVDQSLDWVLSKLKEHKYFEQVQDIYNFVSRVRTKVDQDRQYIEAMSQDIKNLKIGKATTLSLIDPLDAITIGKEQFLDSFSDLKIPIEVEIKHSGKILADPLLLARAVFNILDNSRKAIANSALPGQKIIFIRTEEGENDLRMVIGNTGSSIEKEVQGRLFKETFTTDSKSGSGLGLAIVKSIIDKHNGRVYCESSSSTHTTQFIFEFTSAIQDARGTL